MVASDKDEDRLAQQQWGARSRARKVKWLLAQAAAARRRSAIADLRAKKAAKKHRQ